VLGEAGKVLLLLGNLLPEVEELLLLALADSVVLGGALAALEGITARGGMTLAKALYSFWDRKSSAPKFRSSLPSLGVDWRKPRRKEERERRTLRLRSWEEHQYRPEPWRG
jgi:hypothetical protein